MPKLNHERRRDDQSWVFDWVVKQTGRVQNFEYDSRELPHSVRNYAMIPKHVGRQGSHREAVARAAEEAGHDSTAVAAYRQAIWSYHTAQHCINVDDSPDKIKWHGRLTECMDRLMALSKAPMERVEVPWEGAEIQGIYSPLPDGRQAPCVIVLPGMDSVKERQAISLSGPCRERGFHLLAMDGPGQGISNIRKIRITSDNYERAVSAVIDHLSARPEVDADKIMVMGGGTGSFWSVRAAAHDDRIAAVASGPSTCYGDFTAAFEQVSPRYKRVFMYMAGYTDEDAFDAEVASGLTTVGYGERITCPTLLVQGEFDPMSPVEDGMALYEEVAGPKEFWILEDAFHGGAVAHPNLGGISAPPFMLDWLGDAVLRGRIGPAHARVKWVAPDSGTGPYGDE